MYKVLKATIHQLAVFAALTGCRAGSSSSVALSDTVSENVPQWAKDVYPNDDLGQSVITELVAIIKLHQNHDPFGGGASPGFNGYGLNRVPVGFYVNTGDTTTDLLLINWSGAVPSGASEEADLAKKIDLPVYKVANLNIESLSTQADGSHSYFTVLHGSGMGALDPPYLPVTHPLRQAVGNRSMPLCAPLRRWVQPDTFVLDFDSGMRETTHVIVHEAYHMEERNARDASNPEIDPRRKDLDAAISNDAFVKALIAYQKSVVALVQSAGIPLPDHLLSNATNQHAFALILAAAKNLRTLNEAAFESYVFGEYDEGFADFVALQTMIDRGLYTKADIISYPSKPKNTNPQFYYTGAVGGLAMHALVGDLSWVTGSAYDTQSVWELLGAKLGVAPASDPKELEALIASVGSAEVSKERVKLTNY